MNKSQLTNFINKYTLGGEIKSTKWVSNGDSLARVVLPVPALPNNNRCGISPDSRYTDTFDFKWSLPI